MRFSVSTVGDICPDSYFTMAAGDGLDWIQGGRLDLTGDLPSNTDGGQLSHAQVNGWGQVRELVQQLRGQAEGPQVPGARTATWATVGGDALDIALEYTPGDRMVEAEIGRENGEDAQLTVRILPIRSGFRLTTRGASHDVRVLPAHAAPYAQHMIEKVPPDLSRFLIAPMPGLLVRLDVKEGDKVEAGQALAVVEAMKMENILRAEKSATVKTLNAAAGESLAVDQVILELE